MSHVIIEGKYNSAVVYTNNVDHSTIAQVIELCGQECYKDSRIRIMPDCHAGKGCVIGTTMTIADKVSPSLVGVDIGCGVATFLLKDNDIDLPKLDKVISSCIPSGFNIRETPHPIASTINLNKLKCAKHVDLKRAYRSLGTLGGGNHFIEVDKDEQGKLYLLIHSGSRNLGKQVAEHYQDIAYKKLTSLKERKAKLITDLKAANKEKEIEKELKKLKPTTIKKELAYLEGEDFKNYIHDMKIVQQYARLNRRAIAREISKASGIEFTGHISTVHNYIDTDAMILRKGAVSAKSGQYLLIPLNMRDGSLLCRGKGNSDWNNSAPHGAGRVMSRSKAKELVSLQDYINSMKEVYTSSVNESTKDEAPMVYKPKDEILTRITETVEIVSVLKPTYNFKAS